MTAPRNWARKSVTASFVSMLQWTSQKMETGAAPLREQRRIQYTVFRLKLDARAQLDPTSGISAIGRRESAGDHAKVSRARVAQTWRVEVVEIECIEEIHRELQPDSLRDGGVFPDAHVEVVDREPADGIAVTGSGVRTELHIAIAGVSRARIGKDIQAAARGCGSTDRSDTRQGAAGRSAIHRRVRPVSCPDHRRGRGDGRARSTPDLCAFRDDQRQPALQRYDSGGIPAADDSIHPVAG